MPSIQALCNTFLRKAFDEFEAITPMKMQKLLYFTYKEYLRSTGEQLFTEPLLVWRYGPVVKSVYDEFKSFRGNAITHFAKDAKGIVYVINDRNAPDVAMTINAIWEKYKKYSGDELSKLTHRDDSAWQKAHSRGDDILNDEDIRNEPDFA